MKNKVKDILKICIIMLVVLVPKVALADQIYNIDINVNIDKNGVGHVKESWHTEEDSKDATEKYKVISDLKDIKIRDFKVSSNGKAFSKQEPWDIDQSFEQKANKYGVIAKGDRVELCWGITKFGENTYDLEYKIDPLVVSLNDYDMVYFRFIKENLEPAPDNISITINGYEPFDDEVLMWAFGFSGQVSNEDGAIVAKSDGRVQYGQVMLRLPKGIFDSSYTIDKDFDYYANMAQQGSDYGSNDTEEEKTSNGSPFTFSLIMAIIQFVIAIFIIAFAGRAIYQARGGKYRILNKKKLVKPSKFKDQYYRDIPYDGPLEDTYLLGKNAYQSSITYENYMNAYLLRWIYQDAISYGQKEEKVLLFDKSVSYIKINHRPETMSKLEGDFFDMLENAKDYSDDGTIKKTDIEKYMKDNKETCEKYFENFLEVSLENLSKNGYLTNDKKKKGFLSLSEDPYINQIRVTDKGIGLYKNFITFKNYLKDYSLIAERGVNEVKLWDSFMIYAAIYGISEKVYKNFTDIYPEYEALSYFDYQTIANIASYSSDITSAASKSLSSFQSSGYGGSSSFGGGGGSFGGGSGGSGGGSR